MESIDVNIAKARDAMPSKEGAFPVVYLTGDSADAWGSQGVPNSPLLRKLFAPAQLVTAVSQLLNTGTLTQ
jgi:hypothetical protein